MSETAQANSDGRVINVEQASIRTVTVNRRQVTLSLFRQLIEKPLIDKTGEFMGTPWGRVNYCPDKRNPACVKLKAPPHHHVVWQLDDELRRATIVRPEFDTYCATATEWLLLALDDGWRPKEWRRDPETGARYCDVPIANDVPVTAGLWIDGLSADAWRFLRYGVGITEEPDWQDADRGRLILKQAATKLRDSGETRDALAQAIKSEMWLRFDRWIPYRDRWREIRALPQLFIGA
jgi:hypothetical protein